MAERGEVSVITIGGKGSSLSSSSIFAISTGVAQVRLDSSALDRLASSSNLDLQLVNYQINIPEALTLLESRAFLTVILNKLLHSGSSNVRAVLPVRISEVLNSKSHNLALEPLDVTQEELFVLEKSSATLLGVSAIVDHESTALSGMCDAIAAMSCEATKADVGAFSAVDSGDGFSMKEEVGVASDLKVLLTGSKLVGKVESESVSRIPKVHGSFREIVKLVHSRTRAELNSGVKLANAEGLAVRAMLFPLYDLGLCSLTRAKSNLDSIAADDLRLTLGGLFEGKCPSSESLRNGVKLVSELGWEKENERFVHELNALLGIVLKIVSWEAIAAFVALEGVAWSEKRDKGVDANGEGNVKVDRKGEKKKKVMLGKGTSVIVQLIKDRLEGEGGGGSEVLVLLEKWVESISLLLDPKDREFDGFLLKVKEIVESNESRRLPKLPKVMTFLKLFVFTFLGMAFPALYFTLIACVKVSRYEKHLRFHSMSS